MSHFPLTNAGYNYDQHDDISTVVDVLVNLVSYYEGEDDLSPEDGFHLGRIKLAIKYLEEAIGIVEEDHDPTP